MSAGIGKAQPATAIKTKAKPSLKNKLIRLADHLKREWQIYVLLAPAIIWFILFLYKPMYGLQIAFKDYSIFRGVAGSPWIGFEHFETLFSNDQFIRAVWNTIHISALNLLFGFPAPIILALMFNEILHATYKRFTQTIVYLPHFISTVIIAGIVITAFSPTAGIVNTILGYPVNFANHHHHADYSHRQYHGSIIRADHPAIPACHLFNCRRSQYLCLSTRSAKRAI